MNRENQNKVFGDRKRSCERVIPNQISIKYVKLSEKVYQLFSAKDVSQMYNRAYEQWENIQWKINNGMQADGTLVKINIQHVQTFETDRNYNTIGK